MNKIKGRKYNSEEGEEYRKGKCQYIASIEKGLTKPKNSSKGIINRITFELTVVSKEGVRPQMEDQNAHHQVLQ